MEVTHINKQKFLAELGKLLTFMYDEDRQTALAMYGRMFDNARDEQALIQFLISPTRQAVVIARAYNARERKLQVSTQAKDPLYDEQEGTPDFVHAIEALEDEAISRKLIVPEVPEDQFSLFADGVHPQEEEEPVPVTPAPAKAAEAEEDAPAEDIAPEAAQPEESAEDAAPDVPAAEDEADAEAGAAAADEDDGDEVDAFLSDFSIDGDELDGQDEAPQAKAVPVPVEAEDPDELPDFTFDAPPRPQAAPRRDGQVKRNAPPAVELTERRANVPLLILYIIIAVPLTALGVLILLLPTLLFLALAGGAIVVGCLALTSAFGAFSIFADVMVVLGCALVVLALGLLFLWMFVWLIGGAIAGLINGVIKLAGKWCYKEVPTV